MRSIPTTIQVMPDGTVRFAEDAHLAQGEHRVVLTLLDDEPRRPKDMPIDEFLALVTVDVGAWPAELSLRREAMYGDDGR